MCVGLTPRVSSLFKLGAPMSAGTRLYRFVFVVPVFLDLPEKRFQELNMNFFPEDNIILDEEDDLHDLNLIIYGIPRRVYNRAEYFNSFDKLTFFTRFRVTKPTAVLILNEIEAEIEHPYDYKNSVAPMNQLLIFLRLCATGSHLACIGDFGGVHLSTVSRITKRVGRALAGKNRFIRMPETVEDLNKIQLKFYEKARFPRVIGAVDGTHIRIQSPGGEDAEIFRNRKGYFSINVQTVSSANLKILDLVVRWPGSTHDVTIFNNSRLKQRFENNSFPNSALLGDSGYYLKPYLLTPLLNPATPAEQLYNESHIRTRNSVERQIGVWKRRFPILVYGCRLKLEITLEIVVATAVVYNICKENNEEEPPNPEDLELFVRVMEEDEVPNIPPTGQENNIALGFQTQRNLIENYFSHLAE